MPSAFNSCFGRPHDSTATRYSGIHAPRCPCLCPQHKWQTLHRAIRMELCHLSRSPSVLRAMNLRFAAILPTRPVYIRFTSALILGNLFFYIFAVFLSVFSRISAVFMPFLRSPSFANPLLFDKSAIYLTANHYHSEGRREAEGKQNGGRTDSRPIHSLLASSRFCEHFCQSGTVLQR